MRLYQPLPDHTTPVPVPPADLVTSPVPVYFIRHRYAHHARASGFDRLCDYLKGETIPLPYATYLAGETLLRIPAKIYSMFCGQYEYSRYDFTMELAVRRHFRRHHRSIYHYVYGEKSYRRLAGLSGLNGNRIVLTVHHMPEHLEWLFRSKDHLRRVDHVTVVSRSQIPCWEDIVGKGKVTCVPYAVDVNWFKPPARQANEVPRCLFIGAHERDFDVLSGLVRGILDNEPRAEFCMISSDSRCGEIAARHNRAVWHQRVDDETYLKLLQDSSLLILPLKKSTTCTAALEAMACGLPVLATKGGIEDYLDDRSSRVFEPGDADGMARTALSLLKDETVRLQMSAEAVRRAREFSWTATARKMAELYQEILKG